MTTSRKAKILHVLQVKYRVFEKNMIAVDGVWIDVNEWPPHERMVDFDHGIVLDALDAWLRDLQRRFIARVYWTEFGNVVIMMGENKAIQGNFLGSLSERTWLMAEWILQQKGEL